MDVSTEALYKDGDSKISVNSSENDEWQLEHTFTETNLLRYPQRYLQYMNYHLHLIKKVKPPLDRRIIPSTTFQRLAFYRSFAASPNRARSLSASYQSNGFFWLYIFTVILKTMPHTYIHMFLASYAPKMHLFWHKMSPAFYGMKIFILVVSVFEIIFSSADFLFLMELLYFGIIYKNPWNRCPPNGFAFDSLNITVNCYTIPELLEKVKKETVIYNPAAFSFQTSSNEIFMSVQTGYMTHRFEDRTILTKGLFCIVLYVATAIAFPLIFKKRFWQMLLGTHIVIVFVEIFVFLYSSMFYVPQEFRISNKEDLSSQQHSVSVMHADVDMFLDTISTPPVVHVLTARSLQEICPTRDSTVILLSNTIYYLFRGLLTQKLKLFCESLIHLPLYPQATAYMGWIYLWPMFLSTFQYGNVYTIIFLNLHVLAEFFNFVVVFGCLVEIVKSEWKKLNKCFIAALLATSAGITTMVLSETMILAFSMIGKIISIFVEACILSVMYPMPRLLDDITFHYGIAPFTLRAISLKLIPVISVLVTYITLKGVVSDLPWSNLNNFELEKYLWLFPVLVTPFVLGFFYKLILFMKDGKKNWTKLFLPEYDWGPTDPNLRKLRKMFDSRHYIASQAPRQLSRYMIYKAEPRAYQLDLCYANTATMKTSDYRKDR